jgi:hypothetical protein
MASPRLSVQSRLGARKNGPLEAEHRRGMAERVVGAGSLKGLVRLTPVLANTALLLRMNIYTISNLIVADVASEPCCANSFASFRFLRASLHLQRGSSYVNWHKCLRSVSGRAALTVSAKPAMLHQLEAVVINRRQPASTAHEPSI